jgi:UDPglucose 6-dehydrogenase
VVDLNQDRVATWNSAHLPIHEPGLPKIVRIARDGTSPSTIDLPGLGTVSILKRTPNLTFSTKVAESIAEADIVFICVNTPTKLYGLGAGATADLSILESATTTIAKNAKGGAIIVEKSTVPCGTAHMIRDIVSFGSFISIPVAACSTFCVLLVASIPLAKAGHGHRYIWILLCFETIHAPVGHS